LNSSPVGLNNVAAPWCKRVKAPTGLVEALKINLVHCAPRASSRAMVFIPARVSTSASSRTLLIGVLLGTSLSIIASIILSHFVGVEWTFNFPIHATLVGLAVAFLVGIVFGIYPAKQAAQKSPMEALRYE